MLGISLASFSSGLGELTFLQLSSAYPSGQSLGGFASGTGGAGIVGQSPPPLSRRVRIFACGTETCETRSLVSC